MSRPGRRGSRYANVRIVREDGHIFASHHEVKRYRELKLMQRAGEIRGLQVHPRFYIEINGVPVRYDTGRQMAYEADFCYYRTDTGERIIEDVKMQSGHRTEVYKMKKALMRAMGNEIVEV